MTVKIPVRLQPVRVRRENDIQREVLEALRKMGKFCLRLNSGAIRAKGGFVQLCPAGTPDIVVIERKHVYASEFGVAYWRDYSSVTWLEMKCKDGKLSQKQINFRVEAEARGERYVIARSLDDVLSVL